KELYSVSGKACGRELWRIGGPARIRLKTSANPLSRFQTLEDSPKFGGFWDAAPYRCMIKLVFDEFACSKVQNRGGFAHRDAPFYSPFFPSWKILSSNFKESKNCLRVPL